MQRALAFENSPSLMAALALSSGWLWLNLLRALRLYRRARRDVGSALVVA